MTSFIPTPALPNAVDIHIGVAVRRLREARGLSDADIASLVRVTPQQIERYESGEERVSASMLYELARVLEVPVSAFFEACCTARSPIGIAK